MSTDDELYNRYVNGERHAGDELLLRYDNMLVAYINSLVGNLYDAEDLMIESFTVIFADKPKINPGNFKAYLFRIAHNKACKLLKHRNRLKLVTMPNETDITDDEQISAAAREETRAETLIAKGLTPEEAIWNDERNKILHQCLERIAPQYREALWLLYGTGLSHEQAAKILGCNRKRINNLITNGKIRLRSELEKEGIAYEDI
jgi:RNA polymerase sigma-70 factor (ECF subfamily)